MLDFRMPTISNSGIFFGKLIPEMGKVPGWGKFPQREQFN